MRAFTYGYIITRRRVYRRCSLKNNYVAQCS